MGDRANVFLVMERDAGNVKGLYLYTHWAGSEWRERLVEALKVAKPRWGDDFYFNRIILTEMYKDLVGEDSGGGVSLRMGDNSHDIIICDPITQVVATAPEGWETNPAKWRDKMSFEKAIA